VGLDTDTTRDWVYTDWEEVAAFADAFAERLPATRVPTAARRAVARKKEAPASASV
jgi:hypothetical protein